MHEEDDGDRNKVKKRNIKSALFVGAEKKRNDFFQ